MGKVLFFGYGAYRNKGKISQVLGHNPGEGVGAVLEGYVLVYQTIDQLPESLREFFRGVYGNDFRAYTIRKGEGVVSGMLWEINDEDLVTLKKWEFEGIWREVVEVTVKSSGGKDARAFTEKANGDQPFHEITDGLSYEEFENKRAVQNQKSSEDPYYTNLQIEKIKKWLKTQ